MKPFSDCPNYPFLIWKRQLSSGSNLSLPTATFQNNSHFLSTPLTPTVFSIFLALTPRFFPSSSFNRKQNPHLLIFLFQHSKKRRELLLIFLLNRTLFPLQTFSKPQFLISRFLTVLSIHIAHPRQQLRSTPSTKVRN